MELMDRKQLATLFKKSHKTICRWSKNGTLPEPYLKAGRVWYWTKKQIESIECALVDKSGQVTD